VVFCIGPAGTGKTYLAVMIALSQLKAGAVEKIVLVRPAVEAGEKLGFLPGDFHAKINPYLRPLYDALFDFIDIETVRRYKEKDIIEIVPLAYMRGRTLNRSFMILDEAQNTTGVQMKMFLTRLGMESRAVVTGDITQIDLQNRNQSGLVRVQKILKSVKGVEFVYMSKKDIVRHPIIEKILEAYDKAGKK
jgi:phosphate starvation-inducible PhoH-like protein